LAGTDPEQREALLADSVGLALLIVLETVSPPERLAVVLHDMFATLASRARRRVQGEKTVPRRRHRHAA